MDDVAAALAAGLARLDAAVRIDERAAPVPRLAAYIAGLARWNRVYNLTAVREPAAMVTHHILDSLAVLPWLRGPRLLDVGSGAGLPGIPLAVVRPDLHFTLLDSSAKRTRFLLQMTVELELGNVAVVHARVERHRPLAHYHTVLSRAFASLADFAALAGPLRAPDGRLLALKGRRPDAELAALPADCAVDEISPLRVPGLDAERHVVVLRPALRAPDKIR